MARSSAAQRTQYVKEIGRCFAAGMLDREIMEKLHIKKNAYYQYRKRLFRESGDLFRQTDADELLYHKELLQERLTRMFRQIEIDLNNKDLSNKDRAGLYLAAQSYAMNIFRLNYEGIAALNGIQGRSSLAINTSIGSEDSPRSGAAVVRLLQTQDTGGGRGNGTTTGTADAGGGESTATTILSDAPDILEQKTEPDESEIY